MKELNKLFESLPKINEKNQYYFFGGLLLVFFLLDYFLIMNPQLKTLRTLNPKITLLAGDLKAAKDNIDRLEQYQSDLKKIREQDIQQSKRILSKEAVPVLLEDVSRIANKVGVKLDQIMPLKESQEVVLTRNEGKYFSLPVLINVRGSYHNLGRFINSLESNEVFLNIVSFDFIANREGGQHTARLTATVVVLENK